MLHSREIRVAVAPSTSGAENSFSHVIPERCRSDHFLECLAQFLPPNTTLPATIHPNNQDYLSAL